MILGIDEAGRGPVLGPLVVAAVVASPAAGRDPDPPRRVRLEGLRRRPRRPGAAGRAGRPRPPPRRVGGRRGLRPRGGGPLRVAGPPQRAGAPRREGAHRRPPRSCRGSWRTAFTSSAPCASSTPTSRRSTTASPSTWPSPPPRSWPRTSATGSSPGSPSATGRSSGSCGAAATSTPPPPTSSGAITGGTAAFPPRPGEAGSGASSSSSSRPGCPSSSRSPTRPSSGPGHSVCWALRPMKLLLSYLRPHWRLVLLALLLATINQVFSLLDPLIFRHVIDQYATRFDHYSTGAVPARREPAAPRRRRRRLRVPRGQELPGLLRQRRHPAARRPALLRRASGTRSSCRTSSSRTSAAAKRSASSRRCGRTSSGWWQPPINTVFQTLVGIVFVVVYAFTVHWLIAPVFFATVPLLGWLSSVLLAKKSRSSRR